MKAIHVDHLPFDATEEDVRALFEPYGVVHTVIIVSERDLGEHKCIAFVEMEETLATEAIDAVDGAMVRGCRLEVRESPGGTRRRTQQPPESPRGSA